MITILCVLRSGGVYDASWVEKLQRGVERNLSAPHRFVCLSDIDIVFSKFSGKIDCERIPLMHAWPGWWSKVEIFAPGIVNGPSIYFDLDTVLTGPFDQLTEMQSDFSMLQNFQEEEMVGSGVMWFKDKAPAIVYERFLQDPQRIMDHYQRVRHGSYRGDQAYIYDCLDRNVDKISSPALRSYKKHCRGGLPDGTSIVAFHGRPRPTEINPPWMREHWV